MARDPGTGAPVTKKKPFVPPTFSATKVLTRSAPPPSRGGGPRRVVSPDAADRNRVVRTANVARGALPTGGVDTSTVRRANTLVTRVNTAGRRLVASPTPQRMSAYTAHVRNVQKELRRAGYDIAVDGQWGPQTETAWAKHTHQLAPVVNRANARAADAGGKLLASMAHPPDGRGPKYDYAHSDLGFDRPQQAGLVPGTKWLANQLDDAGQALVGIPVFLAQALWYMGSDIRDSTIASLQGKSAPLKTYEKLVKPMIQHYADTYFGDKHTRDEWVKDHSLLAALDWLPVVGGAARAGSLGAELGRFGVLARDTGDFSRPGLAKAALRESYFPTRDRSLTLASGPRSKGLNVPLVVSRHPIGRTFENLYDAYSKAHPNQPVVGELARAQKAYAKENIAKAKSRRMAVGVGQQRKIAALPKNGRLRLFWESLVPESHRGDAYLDDQIANHERMKNEPIQWDEYTPSKGVQNAQRRVDRYEKEYEAETGRFYDLIAGEAVKPLQRDAARLRGQIAAARAQGVDTHGMETALESVQAKINEAHGRPVAPVSYPERDAFRDSLAKAVSPEYADQVLALIDSVAREQSPDNPSAWLHGRLAGIEHAGEAPAGLTAIAGQRMLQARPGSQDWWDSLSWEDIEAMYPEFGPIRGVDQFGLGGNGVHPGHVNTMYDHRQRRQVAVPYTPGEWLKMMISEQQLEPPHNLQNFETSEEYPVEPPAGEHSPVGERLPEPVNEGPRYEQGSFIGPWGTELVNDPMWEPVAQQYRGDSQAVFYSYLKQVVDEKMQPKATVDQVRALFKKEGVKQDELDWTDVDTFLDTWKETHGNKAVPKDELQKWLTDNGVQLREQLLKPDEETGSKHTVKYGEYLEPLNEEDATGYRELLLTLPEDKYGALYTEGHYSGFKNVLAHIRFNVNDNGTLQIHEIQSDWHQAGRKRGYRKNKAEREREAAPLQAKWDELDEAVKAEEERLGMTLAEAQAKQRELSEAARVLQQDAKAHFEAGTQPLVHTVNQWDLKPGDLVDLTDGTAARVESIDSRDTEGGVRFWASGGGSKMSMPEWMKHRVTTPSGEKRLISWRNEVEAASRESFEIRKMNNVNARYSERVGNLYDTLEEAQAQAEAMNAARPSEADAQAASDAIEQHVIETNDLHKLNLERMETADQISSLSSPSGVESAPWAKTWHELAMKRMLRWAVDNGYTDLAWSTGHLQARRWDFSEEIPAEMEAYQNPTVRLWDEDPDGGETESEWDVNIRSSTFREGQGPNDYGNDFRDNDGEFYVEFERDGDHVWQGELSYDELFGDNAPGLIATRMENEGGHREHLDDLPRVVAELDASNFTEESVEDRYGYGDSSEERQYTKEAHGQSGFYDKMLGGFLTKYLKKYPGSRVHHTKELPATFDMYGDEPDFFNYLSLSPEAVADIKAGQRLFQQEKGVPKGMVELVGNRQYLMQLFSGADPTTAVHELGHVLVHDLEPQEIAAVEKHVAGGRALANWSTADHENWAKTVERYVFEGKAPTKALGQILAKLSAWMKKVYATVEQIGIGEIHPEVRDALDRVFGAVPSEADRIRYAGTHGQSRQRIGGALSKAIDDRNAIRRRDVTAQANRSLPGKYAQKEKLERQLALATEEQAPALEAQLAELDASIERTEAVRGAASKRRQVQLDRRIEGLRQARTYEPDENYDAAVGAMQFFTADSNRIMSEVFGPDWVKEIGEPRQGLMTRELYDEDEPSDIFTPHRMSRQRTSIVGSRPSAKSFGKPNAAALRATRQNKLTLYNRGDMLTDPDVLFDHWTRAQAFAFALDLRTALRSVAEPIDVGTGPKPGYWLFNPKGRTKPSWWQAAQEGDPAAFTGGIESFFHSIIGKEGDAAMLDETGHYQADVMQISPQAIEQLASRLPGSEPKSTRLGEGFDLFAGLTKAALLYANPGYIPANFVGNLIFLGLYAPLGGIRGIFEAGKMLHGNRELATRVMGEVGETPTASLQPEIAGLAAKDRIPRAILQGERKLAQTIGGIADVSPRMAAWITTARKLGYKTHEDMNRLLDGETEKTLRDRQVASHRATEGMVNFDRLSPSEKRYFQRIFFVWPWIRGATAWVGHYAKEYPERMGVLASGGKREQDKADKLLGPVPDYYDLFPLSRKGNVASVLNMAPLSPTSTGVELAQTVGGFARSAVTDEPLPEFKSVWDLVNPTIDLAVKASKGQGDYGEEKGVRSIFQDFAVGPHGDTGALPALQVARQMIDPADDPRGPWLESGRWAEFKRRVIRVAPQLVDVKKLNALAKKKGPETPADREDAWLKEVQRWLGSEDRTLPQEARRDRHNRLIYEIAVDELQQQIKDSDSFQPSSTTKRTPSLTLRQDAAVKLAVLRNVQPGYKRQAELEQAIKTSPPIALEKINAGLDRKLFGAESKVDTVVSKIKRKHVNEEWQREHR